MSLGKAASGGVSVVVGPVKHPIRESARVDVPTPLALHHSLSVGQTVLIAVPNDPPQGVDIPNDVGICFLKL